MKPKFSLGRCSTPLGTLQIIQLFLAVLIVIGLELTDIANDYLRSSNIRARLTREPYETLIPNWRNPCEEPNFKKNCSSTTPTFPFFYFQNSCPFRCGPRAIPIANAVGETLSAFQNTVCCGSLEARGLKECPNFDGTEAGSPHGQCCEKWKEPTQCIIYWTGTLWTIVVGILGLIAGAVVIANLFVDVPKSLMQIYHLVAAVLILFVSALALGLNQITDTLSVCNADKTYKEKQNAFLLENFRNGSVDRARDEITEKYFCPYGLPVAIAYGSIASYLSTILGMMMLYLYFFFVLSCVLVLTHVIAFIITCKTKTSDKAAASAIEVKIPDQYQQGIEYPLQQSRTIYTPRQAPVFQQRTTTTHTHV